MELTLLLLSLTAVVAEGFEGFVSLSLNHCKTVSKPCHCRFSRRIYLDQELARSFRVSFLGLVVDIGNSESRPVSVSPWQEVQRS